MHASKPLHTNPTTTTTTTTDAVALVLFNIFSKFVGAELTPSSMGFALLDFLIIFIGAYFAGWLASASVVRDD